MPANSRTIHARLTAVIGLAVAVLASTLLVAAPAQATIVDSDPVNGIRYTYDNSGSMAAIAAGATVKSYSGVDLAVAIPASVSLPGSATPYPVTAIGNSAFSGDGLTSVTIPDSVTTIGQYAFENNNLTDKVTIGNNVVTIGYQAFDTANLTNVTIPNSVITIGSGAFMGNHLTNVTIGNHVSTISTHAFIGSDLTNVTIPNSVEIIGDYAFYGNDLTNVSIGNSATYIGNFTFLGNKLTDVSIPNSVHVIGESAFYDNKLTNVSIGILVSDIAKNAFNNNPALSSVRFSGPAPLMEFGMGAPQEPFDSASGSLVLYYAPAFGNSPTYPGGYMTPLWYGYPTVPATVTGVAPTITGTPREGSVLVASTGAVNPNTSTLTYQWFADGAPIGGANQAVLGLGAAQAGRRISVRITASFPPADSVSVTSAATGIISSPYKRLVLSSYVVRKGQGLVVTATGLKPNQKYKIQLNKKTRASGRADAFGTIQRVVTFKSNTKSGKRSVKVTGSKAKHVKKFSISTKVRYFK